MIILDRLSFYNLALPLAANPEQREPMGRRAVRVSGREP